MRLIVQIPDPNTFQDVSSFLLWALGAVVTLLIALTRQQIQQNRRLETQNVNLSKLVTDTAKKLEDEHREQIAELRRENREIESKMEAKVTRLEKKIDDLETELDECNQSREAAAAEYQRIITEKNGEVSKLRTANQELRQRVETLETNATQRSEELNTERTKTKHLKDELEGTRVALAELERRFQAIEQRQDASTED
jgi:chromosome segregation ATPase